MRAEDEEWINNKSSFSYPKAIKIIHIFLINILTKTVIILHGTNPRPVPDLYFEL